MKASYQKLMEEMERMLRRASELERVVYRLHLDNEELRRTVALQHPSLRMVGHSDSATIADISTFDWYMEPIWVRTVAPQGLAHLSTKERKRIKRETYRLMLRKFREQFEGVCVRNGL